MRRLAKAFTLAELLIALGILGVIATFTIPKILMNQASSKKQAVFRETISLMNDVLHTGIITGGITYGNMTPYVLSHVNAVKVCNNSFTEGCWTHTAILAADRNESGFILHNGATICSIMDDVDGHEEIEIDWNGATGPNVEGDDQIELDMCYATGADCRDSRKKAGTLLPFSTASRTLYQSIFSGT